MKQELTRHLLPLVVIFFVASLIWTFTHVSLLSILAMFLGLALGAFILDLDHLIFWFFLRPNLEESHLAAVAWKRADFKALGKLLEATHEHHTNLIFHHYFFQIVLTIISFFVFTSSNFVFAKSLLLAANIHLLVDEIADFRRSPAHLQEWLFARENKQLPTTSLKYYLATFILTATIFTYLLIF